MLGEHAREVIAHLLDTAVGDVDAGERLVRTLDRRRAPLDRVRIAEVADGLAHRIADAVVTLDDLAALIGLALAARAERHRDRQDPRCLAPDCHLLCPSVSEVTAQQTYRLTTCSRRRGGRRPWR